ncbi:hypothetical protein EJA70_13150 [Pseudomonas sp. PB103]|nr:hypothetical protein EJA70_13150 [Pseudomonas sp. PB103]
MKLALGAGHAGAAGATLKRRGSIPRLGGAYTRRQSFVGRMGGRISDSGFALQDSPPHPSPLPQGGEGEREPMLMLFRSEFSSVFQVGVSRTNNRVSPLSLWERARVRELVAICAGHTFDVNFRA